VVRDAGQAVLTPAIGTRPRLVMAEVIPGVATLAVVLTDGPPLPLAQVRSPFLPGHLLFPSFVKPDGFCGHNLPPFESKRQTEHVFVMSGNWLKPRLLGRIARLAAFPGVFAGREKPEVAFRVPHNPLLRRLVHEQRCYLFP